MSSQKAVPVTHKTDGTSWYSSLARLSEPALAALLLRVGIGLVFVIGGAWKLSRLLHPEHQADILVKYWSPSGYVNAFSDAYLFHNELLAGLLTPWIFLTTLSAIELVSGLMLVAGLLVRPLALLWALVVWTFIIALPVVTAPGIPVTVVTHESPALLVQIRDVGLSGMAFVLFAIGAGAHSLDHRLMGATATRARVNWDSLGLLLRLAVAAPFIVGGLFAGYDSIPTFKSPWWLLLPIGLLLAGGVGVRVAAGGVVLVMFWVVLSALGPDRSVLDFFNAFKREIAYLAAGILLLAAGGGQLFRVTRLWRGFPDLLRPGRDDR